LGTASRVLSGHPATSAEARARVTQAVTELGYRPNAQARSLRLTRTHAIGLLVSDVRNPFFADVAHAAEQAALGADFVTLLGNATRTSNSRTATSRRSSCSASTASCWPRRGAARAASKR
jgi:LacI family transcriptional regulator